ncbi:uncharacterized protein LOC111308584 [Durio zibethinus]|uniref:Uncharacterized protein LOC111308584 n=1 Tax=Durio zibethinus TaxID=66656 RepID=A0A6P6AD22_DURZI|nr:uncharacterized protein LOC111308584 [Durio zibethinus]
MNGYSYSRIKVVGNGNSRSMDSSDLKPLPETSKPTAYPIPNPKEKNPEIDHIIKNSNPTNTHDSSEQELDDQEGTDGVICGPKLRRNSSVSSAYALQAAVKRAFSMRRSSSVSERYCRIHDQSVTLASPFDDEELDITGRRRSVKKKKNRGKILKAWKKLFGL